MLSLGRTPLANSLLHEEQLSGVEPTYPLDFVFCPGCTLLQITETVPPEELFRDYAYFSSFSDTMLDHAKDLARRMIKQSKLSPSSLVVELASNDGYLLQYYKQAGVRVLGVEPASNIAEAAERSRGIPTICEFFGQSLAGQLAAAGRSADVVHAHNVLAHVADLPGFVAGIRTLLKANGVAVIEVPYLKDLLDNVEFDTIYHEHLCYFSLTALEGLFRRCGLVIFHVGRLAIHGGSLRLFAARADARRRRQPSTQRLLEEEAGWGVEHWESYQPFSVRVAQLRADLLSLLHGLKAKSKRIAAYGASAKGSTLLHYLQIGQETLDYVVDRSTVKQGRYTPGTHLKIHDPAKLLEDAPDYALLLTWNFAEEILAQQAQYRAKGGRFIIPIPEVRVA